MDTFDVDRDVDDFGRPKFSCRIKMTGFEMWPLEVDMECAVRDKNWTHVAKLCHVYHCDFLLDQRVWIENVAPLLLDKAIQAKNWDSLRRLASLGCDMNRFFGYKPVLHYAVEKASVEVVDDLLAMGADPRYTSIKTGKTALHVAAVRGTKRGSPCIEEQLETLQIIELLRKHGAMPIPMGFDGEPNRAMPDQLAKEKGLLVIMQALR